MVVRRPIDCLAILTASVASIVIIINAVFLQSGFRHGTDQSEGLVSKVQKPQAFLKSEGKRLRRKIDSAVVGIKSMETRDEFAEFVFSWSALQINDESSSPLALITLHTRYSPQPFKKCPFIAQMIEDNACIHVRELKQSTGWLTHGGDRTLIAASK